MKLSMYAFFSDLLTLYGAEYAVRFAKECGFPSIEILEMSKSGGKPLLETRNTAEELRRVLDQNGMTCCCYSVGINILSEQLGEKRNLSGVDVLKRCADLAKILGAPYFHHTLTIGYKPARESDTDPLGEILPELLDRATAVAKYASELGLTVLYEPQGHYVNGMDGFARFYDEMRKRTNNVGVCGDIGNSLFVNCQPSDFIKQYAAEIRHVHLKDFHMENECLNRKNDGNIRSWQKTKDGKYLTAAMLGDGIVDMDACMRALREVNYQGIYSLETFYQNTSNASLKENLRYEREYMLNRYPDN